MRKRTLLVILAIFPAWGADLPVRQVILYKHGVGFFERSGTIPAGETARLDFKATEMNDVLKSLIINGKNERVAGLRYDSSIPLGQKLAEFPFAIAAGQPLAGVMDQLKGARLELQIGNEKVAGAIVAARVVAGEKEHAERQQIVLLLDAGDLRTFDLDAASAIRFTDAKVQAQFRDYLGALTAARSKEKRSVYIDGSSGGRDITADYIIPAPIWKSSYRLLFAEVGEPTLEGWAIVDNTTGEDWKNVQMALVSGKPISFISELYAPRYINRATAELPEEEALRPELHEGSAQTISVDAASTSMAPSAGLVMPEQMRVTGRSGAQQFLKLQSTPIVASANGSEIADLFEYRIAQPVTIKANESAMLPFLQDKIQARKVDIYSDMSAAHPLTAAELVNSNPKTLDGGPITVYDGGSYVGEALVETVKAGDKRLISYGVDLGVRITNKLDSETREEREIHVKRGVMQIRAARVRQTTYSVKNLDAKAKTLIIEHPLDDSFKLMNQKPSETTTHARRFELKLTPLGSQSFPVIEEKVEFESQSISNLTPDVLVQFTSNKHLSDAGRREIEQVVALKRELAMNSNAASATQQKINGVTQDEERVRKNLASLNGISGQQELVQKYATQLAGLEQLIATLRDKESDLAAKNTQLATAVDDRIEKMSF